MAAASTIARRRTSQQFLADYRANGRGAMLVLVPVGPGGRGASQGLEAVRGALASAGVAARQMQVQTYSVPDKLLASPIRLSFTKMQAKVLSQCGDWRQDLAGGPHLDTWQNKPYPNLGCAYQTALAARSTIPSTSSAPRAEGRSDIGRRMKIVEDCAQGRGSLDDMEDRGGRRRRRGRRKQLMQGRSLNSGS